MSSEATPAAVLPTLKASTEALESELTQDLNKHSEQTFSKISDTIENALNALQPLEDALEQVDRELEQSVQDAMNVIHGVVRKAVQQVNPGGNAKDLAEKRQSNRKKKGRKND